MQGEAKPLKQAGDLMTIRGTPTFMAPEVFRAEKYGVSADTFSFALVLLELATEKSTEERFKDAGMEPNAAAHWHAMGNRVDLDKPCSNSVDTAIGIVVRCWNADANARPSMHECAKMLEKMAATAQEYIYTTP